MKAVLITLAAFIAATCIYSYFFAIGWRVDSEDLKIKYSYDEESLRVDFELTDGRVLSAWIGTI